MENITQIELNEVLIDDSKENVPVIMDDNIDVQIQEDKYMSVSIPKNINQEEIDIIVNQFIEKVSLNPLDMTLSSDIYKFGQNSANMAIPNVALYDTLISDIMKSNQAGPVEGSKDYNLLQLKRELDLINPAVLAETPIKQKMLVFFSKTSLPGSEKIMDMIYERKETVKNSIDGIKVALLQNANDLDHQMVDLMTIYKELIKSNDVLKGEIYAAQLIYNKIVDMTFEDPIAQDNMNSVVADLTTQINSLLVEENMNTQFFAGTQLTAKLVREQQNQIRILVRQMEKAVLANLGLRVVAKGLEESVNQSKSLGNAIANTIADTAKANEATTDKLIQARSEGYIDISKLQEGVDSLMRTFEKESKANELITKQGLIISKQLQTATAQLKMRIDKESTND